MAFTAQEKAEASRFVLGMLEHSKGLVELANVAGENANNMRPQLQKAFSGVFGAWIHSRLWMANLTDNYAKAGTPRETILLAAKNSHGAVVQYANSLVTHCATVPEFAQANVHFTAARDIFAPFDWTLPYVQPRHDNNPNTPFDESKTIVGPHGDWITAIGSMIFVMWYMGETWTSFSNMMTKASVWPQDANGPLKVLLLNFAHLMNRISRVCSMHIEVEAPQDTATIDADHAAASGARSRAFHRAMLQTELLFNQRMSVGNNWHGRPFEVGAVEALNLQHLEDWFIPMARANGEQYSWNMMLGDVGQFGGDHAGFTGRMTDFWQVLDAWAQSAFGFYHVLPNPTVFVPIVPEPPPGNTTIPLGFFNDQAAQIAQSKAEVAGVQAELNALESSLRSLEGTEI